MLVKIKENAYKQGLRELRGQWVEVDTKYVFNNQYNLKDYNLRIFDEDIEAVKDDVRSNRTGCGYCGKQFESMEELEAHFLEEEAKINHCEGCFWYQSYIKDTKREKEEFTNEAGERLTKDITIHTWGKQCKYKEGCTHNEHRKYKITTFTPENTYFLKFPNGYKAYFKSLSLTEQWKECGFTFENNVAYMGAFVGSYALSLHYNENGLDKIRLINRRKEFIIPAVDAFESGYCVSSTIYTLQKTILKDFPKSTISDLAKVLNYLKDESRRCDYKKELFKF